MKEIKTSSPIMQRWKNVLDFKSLKIENGERKAREGDRRERKVNEQYVFCYRENIMAHKVPRLCPLVLLVKFGRKEGKAFGREGDYIWTQIWY